MRKNYEKFYEKFEKFHCQKLVKHISNSSKFFRFSLFLQNINFFETLNDRENGKQLWEILRKF